MRLSSGEVRGRILFAGEDINILSEERIRRLRWKGIACVFQNISNVLDPVYRVIDQVAEPITTRGNKATREAREKAAEMLSRCGLEEHHFKAYPHQLSGGEQQRVLLAMALVNDPDLLLLDEPLSALDAENRAQMSRLITEIGNHRARLLVTHDLDTAARLANELVVLYAGRIVETGPVTEVLSAPRHPYTRALVRSYPNMKTTKDLQSISGSMRHAINGCSFHERCSQSLAVCHHTRPRLKGDKRQIACHRNGIITLLAAENITKKFAGIEVLKGVTLEIKSGETVALVGQSGSGKTTLANTITGFHKADGGNIRLEDHLIRRYDKAFYRDVQIVYQNPGQAINPRFNVIQSLTEPLIIQQIGSEAERREKAVSMLAQIELPVNESFLNEYPYYFSGGELQRLAIGRALMLDPKLLITDEPTSALDSSNQAKILKLLLKLQDERGLSLLYITHDIAVARKIADRLVVMKEGRIVEQGPAAKIITSPEHGYTRKLLVAASSV
jgi:peptide/nickel transport system ATP-binding protein